MPPRRLCRIVVCAASAPNDAYRVTPLVTDCELDHVSAVAGDNPLHPAHVSVRVSPGHRDRGRSRCPRSYEKGNGRTQFGQKCVPPCPETFEDRPRYPLPGDVVRYGILLGPAIVLLALLPSDRRSRRRRPVPGRFATPAIGRFGQARTETLIQQYLTLFGQVLSGGHPPQGLTRQHVDQHDVGIAYREATHWTPATDTLPPAPRSHPWVSLWNRNE